MPDLVDDISTSSNSDMDPIGDLIIDQMSISGIADYIDLKCHNITNEPWSRELQFPSVEKSSISTYVKNPGKPP